MKISIISGSQSKNSQSYKVAKYLENELKLKNIDTFTLNLATAQIPFLNEDFFDPSNENWKKIWSPISTQLKESNGIIIISPEWHGMVPAALKNFFLLWNKSEVAHKAGLIVAVSAGVGGAYIVNEVRTSGYKNSRICYIPEHLIIRNCNNVLNKEEAESQDDSLLRKRISQTLDLFTEYTKALSAVREKNAFSFDTFANGM